MYSHDIHNRTVNSIKFEIDFKQNKLFKEIKLYNKVYFLILKMQTIKPTEIKKSDKASIQEQKCRDKILDAMKLRGYSIITDINTIKKQIDPFEFLCACGEIKNTTYNNLNLSILKKGDEFLPNCCIKSNKVNYKWYLDSNIQNSYTEPETNIKWIQFETLFWISENANCINSKSGEVYKIHESNFITTSFKRFNICNIMAILFKIPNFELLENNSDRYVAQFGTNNKSDKNISSIIIIDKSKILSDNRKNPNKKTEINEEQKSLTPLDIENVPHKTLDWFSEDYVFYQNGMVYFKPKKDWYEFKSNNNRNVIRISSRKEKTDKEYYNDILMIMAFNPYQNFTKYEDYSKNRKLKIIHKNEKQNDDSISNLEVDIKLTVIEQRKLNVENRIKLLHEEIIRILKKKNWTLKSDLSKITAGSEIIYYTCICNPIDIRATTINNLKDTEDTKCKNCTHLNKNDTRIGEELNFEKDGETFIKISECYIGSNGTIISNDKITTHTIRKNDHSVKINNIDYNAKKLIANAFKIKYYEYIDDKYDNKFYVAFKDKNKRNKYSVDNLFIWAYSLENQDLVYDNKEFVTIKSPDCSGKFKNELNNKEKECINTNYIELNEYPGYKFYSSGVIETKTGYITPGLKDIKNSNNDDTNDDDNEDNYYMKYTINNETVKLHRLFCFAFNKLDGLNKLSDYDLFEVDHINGKKYDNRSINLEWVLRKENIQRAIATGLCSYTIPISAYILNKDKSKGEFYKTYPCISWATKDTGCSYEHIKNVANGKTPPYKYIWEYVSDKDINFNSKNKHKNEKRIQVKPKKITKEQVLNYEDPEIYEY